MPRFRPVTAAVPRSPRSDRLPPSRPSASGPVWRRILLALALGTGCPHAGSAADAGAPTPPAPAPSAEVVGPVGPWGQLRRLPWRINTPIPALNRLTLPDTSHWGFAGMAWPEVATFLRSCALTPPQLAALLDPSAHRFDPVSDTTVVTVPDAVRWSLSPASRERIYRLLSAYQVNAVHALPYVVASDAEIARAQLNPRLVAALGQLSFFRGARRCLVDADLLPPLAEDAAELQRLKRFLYTFNSLYLELLRPPPEDRAAIARYWQKPGGRTSREILRVFDRSPDLESIDAAQFLPALPRRLLNTFPDGDNCPVDANCFWISLNFFRDETNDQFLPNQSDRDDGGDAALDELKAHYDFVPPPYRYGDVLCFMAETGDMFELVHMVVYLADDIVLSKNGAGRLSPFALTRLETVTHFYAWAFELKVRGFRPRPGSPAFPALLR